LRTIELLNGLAAKIMVSSSTSISVLSHYAIISESVIILISGVDQNWIDSLNSIDTIIKNR
jgi:hypothetical protein